VSVGPLVRLTAGWLGGFGRWLFGRRLARRLLNYRLARPAVGSAFGQSSIA
jgi:hypothetical protein